ncbi:MAG TPA: ferredoxin [Pseudonocardiaceae bacterium]|nr:ferredoxin [Pseudonocardiaceae bacterium]
MAYVISEGCLDVKDRTCLDNCPVDCIYEGVRMVYIHPDECIDCGACEPLCPQDAIYFEPHLPDELSQYAAINAEFFSATGSPGGATGVDYTDRDHPAVAVLPTRPANS